MRKEERQQARRPARIELGNGQTQTCRIANVSRGGALLLIPDSEWLPKEFKLVDTFTGTRREVRVVWTASNRAGVQYVSGSAAPAKRQSGFGKRVQSH
jgi:hypothetical protein